MVELPKKKVGIVACSGEELPEGTVTRLAALQVLGVPAENTRFLGLPDGSLSETVIPVPVRWVTMNGNVWPSIAS